jgi:hypothetical protein
MLTVPLSSVNYTAQGVYGGVLWDPTLAPELWRRIRLDIPVAPTKTSVKSTGALTVSPSAIDLTVQNGSSINGLGAKAMADLSKVGFVSMGPATTALISVTKTTITYDPAYSESLRTLHAALPGSLLVSKKGLGKTFVVTVGADYKGVATFLIPTKTSKPTPTAKSPFVVQSGTDAICK